MMLGVGFGFGVFPGGVGIFSCGLVSYFGSNVSADACCKEKAVGDGGVMLSEEFVEMSVRGFVGGEKCHQVGFELCKGGPEVSDGRSELIRNGVGGIGIW